MPQGLQVRDENGNLQLDVTSRLGVLLGVLNTNKVNGSLSVPDFSKGTPFFFANITENISSITAIAPRVYVSNNIIYWVYDGDADRIRLASRIFYGIY